MGNKINPNSTRQQGVSLLDSMTDEKRAKCLEVLKETFSISHSHAATIYRYHQEIGMANGNMKKVFQVRDIRDGKSTEPYLKVINTFHPERGAASTPAQAKKRYELDLKKRIAKSKRLEIVID